MSWIPGWDSIASAGGWSNFYFWAGIVALLLLGVMEGVSHRYAERKDELVADEQAAIQRRHDEDMARVQHDAAQANERAAQLERDAAELNVVAANAGHVSLDQLKVMSAIESCRTAALGGHVARCEKCSHTHIAYNSCRNRHCPKCQGAAAKEWLAEREAELLPVPYYHVVFTLPAPIADIAYQNKAVIYGILFKAAAEATLTIAADPKRLGAKIGITAVLHSWGSAMTHHPHVRMIVPGGGISLDGTRWVSCRPRFFLPVRVLSRLFRRLFLGKLLAAHQAGRLAFFGDHAAPRAFAAFLAPLRKAEWVVYAKKP